ncbi:MAG: hypothetical protein OER88_08685 [Planctomycetota bacterium]|nr:hypothetical protein [Planctomycetota bacterium]
MREVGAALTVGLKAPLARWRLVLLLWLVRLVPIVAAFGLPVYARAAARSSRLPNAGDLLAADSADGFAFAWTSDFFQDFDRAADTVFWLVVVTWLLVAFVAGGVIATLAGRRTDGFLVECGRYAGRFLRLALLSAFLCYLADVGINAILAEWQGERAKDHLIQDFAVARALTRGLLFVTLIHVLGAVHSYARIDIVAFDRRSAALSWLRGWSTLLRHFFSLVALEAGMLAVAGLAAGLAFVVHGALAPAPDGSWFGVAVFMLGAALCSYLRSGVELGAVDARCRLLVPAAAPSQIETLPSLEADEPESKPAW